MYGQKRAHSPDGYEDNNFRSGPQYNRGGHHGGGFYPQQQNYGGPQRYHKRHRGEQYIPPASLEDKIAGLGETGSRSSDIGDLAKEIDLDLENKSQIEERIIQITSKICKSIVSFPTRVSTYATLIGLISVKNYNVACQIIQTLHASYPVYLEAQKWQEALTIIHLLSSLVNCRVIKPLALLSQFEFLLESTLEDNIPQTRSDYYVYTVLSSLPYVAKELSEQEESKENFEKMLTTIENYLSKRSKDHLKVIRVWQSDDSTIQMDYLDSLWVQTKNFRANNWIENYINRPYFEKEYKDTMASSLIPSNSPTFQIPGHSEKYVYPPPKIVFRIYDDDVTDQQRSIPGSDKIERFCIENTIRFVIDETSADPKACARHLSHLYNWEKLPLKYLLIETILGELFTLPKPKHDEILYHSLLNEFFKIYSPNKNPDEIKNNYDIVLNEAVRVLFNNLDTMSVTCLTRFVMWFTFHLNNNDMIYPWQAWTDANNTEANSLKATFVHDILERLTRLSFHIKISTLVENHLTSLMPTKAEIKYQPVFTDNPKAVDMADTVKKLIAFKADGAEICQKLNIKLDSVTLPDDFVLRDEKLADQLLKIDIFAATLLDMARKTLTHLSSAFGKYLNVLRVLVQVPQGQIQLLRTLHTCLTTHPQLLVILVDKMLKVGLIEASELVNWVFSEEMKEYHVKSYLWEILNASLLRVNQNIANMINDKKNKEDEIKDTKQIKEQSKNDGSGTPNPDDDETNGDKGNNDGDVEMKTQEDAEVQKSQTMKIELEEFDSKINNAKAAFKSLLIKVFTAFAGALADHIRAAESKQRSFMDCNYRWLTGRMQEVFYNHYGSTCELTQEIRNIIDSTPSIGGLIVNLNQ